MSTVLKVSACPPGNLHCSGIQYLPEDSVSTLPPVKPKAGEVYFYTPGKDVSKKGTYTVLSLEFLFHFHVHT